MPYVYASFVIIALMGMFVFRKGISMPRVIGASIGSSMVLFVVSNFGVWASGTMYAPTWNGLMTCYLMALPYLRNTMLGDLFYAGVFFGGYALATRYSGLAALVPVTAGRHDG